jgi:hypothetical protein
MHWSWRVSWTVTCTRCLLYQPLEYGSLVTLRSHICRQVCEICRSLGEGKRGTLYFAILSLVLNIKQIIFGTKIPLQLFLGLSSANIAVPFMKSYLLYLDSSWIYKNKQSLQYLFTDVPTLAHCALCSVVIAIALPRCVYMPNIYTPSHMPHVHFEAVISFPLLVYWAWECETSGHTQTSLAFLLSNLTMTIALICVTFNNFTSALFPRCGKCSKYWFLCQIWKPGKRDFTK